MWLLGKMKRIPWADRKANKVIFQVVDESSIFSKQIRCILSKYCLHIVFYIDYPLSSLWKKYLACCTLPLGVVGSCIFCSSAWCAAMANVNMCRCKVLLLLSIQLLLVLVQLLASFKVKLILIFSVMWKNWCEKIFVIWHHRDKKTNLIRWLV